MNAPSKSVATPVPFTSTLAWIRASPVMASDTTPVILPVCAHAAALSQRAKPAIANRFINCLLNHHAVREGAPFGEVNVHEVGSAREVGQRKFTHGLSHVFITQQLSGCGVDGDALNGFGG